MTRQKVVTYYNYNACESGIEDCIKHGWKVVSMVSVPTDKTTHEVYCKIIVVYEHEVEEDKPKYHLFGSDNICNPLGGRI